MAMQIIVNCGGKSSQAGEKMTQKKHKTFLYKHAQLVENLSAEQSPVTGFSIDVDRLLQDIETFKSSFRSDFISVIMIQEGSLELSINLETVSITAGSLIIIAPGAAKKMLAAEKDTRISTVHFTLDFLAAIGMLKVKTDLFDYISLQYIPHWILDTGDKVLVHALMYQLYEKSKFFNDHPHGRELLYHTFYIFLYEIAALSKKNATPVSAHRGRKENLVVRFTQLVREQYKSQRTLESYARALNVTAKHLSESVKEITGKTAGEIIDDFVLLEAKLLLGNPELSIAEIANELHFGDQSIFGKFFKRLTGLSPKQYRQTL
ncbi:MULTISPECIES: helix-turn-helix domain-containing protein [Niastella]|uniref:Helix-turn-helix transcriptional regulator n=1 Tax=Niastella soli TaxID=2821487 RepID=A0ABS3YXA8_9BACT|nr:AraC family transcriptional regulator [Niastella soli]MBO9202564.1 helix-turn-helix transcriptional regulator [Niastella soli]